MHRPFVKIHACDSTARSCAVSSARMLTVLLAGLAVSGAAAGCSSQIDRHGHQFSENEVQQVRPGMSRDQVKLQIGTPDTTSTVGGGDAFYYISSTKETTAFLPAKEIDRKVLAVYFTPLGAVERVANYGLKDGKVINLISRQTPSHAAEKGMLEQLFRNLGYKQIYG